MIYFEFQLSGTVKIYYLTDLDMILRANIELDGQNLPPVDFIEDARAYFRAGCFQFEAFESMAQAMGWVATYSGFRADQARKAFADFCHRRGGGQLAAA